MKIGKHLDTISGSTEAVYWSNEILIQENKIKINWERGMMINWKVRI